MKHTKNSAIDLTDVALSIVILGITVAVGTQIIGTYRDSRLTALPTYAVTNETQNVTTTGVELSTEWFQSVALATNSTGGQTIPANNYTTTTNGFGKATISAVADSPWASDNWNITYNVRNTSDPQWAIANDAQVGLATYGDWFTIIAVISIAGLVLGLLFLTLGNKGNNVTGGASF